MLEKNNYCRGSPVPRNHANKNRLYQRKYADFSHKKHKKYLGKSYSDNCKSGIQITVRVVEILEFLSKEIKEFVDGLYGMPDDERLFPIVQEAVQHKMKNHIKKEVTMERDNLLRQLSQNQKLFQEQKKEWEEKFQTQSFEMELLKERNDRLESNLRYIERQLSRKNKTGNWQTRRIREFGEEVAKLKNRTLW